MDNTENEYFIGSTQLHVTDDTQSISFPVSVHYPTHEVSSPTAFGNFVMDVSVDAK